MAKLMGFEGKLYWGSSGSTAATELTIARDVTYRFENDEADVSDRASIINLMDVAGVSFSLEFEVNNQSSNSFIAAVRTAAAAGTPMAFKTRDVSAGYGVDADFIVSVDENQALRDAQRLRVSAKPTDAGGRTPSWTTG